MLLPFFSSTAEQNNQCFTIFTEIYPVAGAKIYPALKHTAAHAFHPGKISVPDANEISPHFSGGRNVEVIKPPCEWTFTVLIFVFPNLNHKGNIYDTITQA